MKKFYAIGYDDPKELIVQWNLGNVCNWSCEYCPKWLNDGSVYWTSNDIIEENLLKIKNKFPNQKIRVEFLGGEVTLKPDFLNLMRFCKDHEFSTFIISNASRTVNYWEKLAPFIDTAILTFHPLTANKKHYENIIDVLISRGSRPMCHMAMVKDHFWDLVEYKKYLENKYSNKISTDILIIVDKDRQLPFNGYYYDYDKDQLELFKSQGSKCYVVEDEEGNKQELSLGEVHDRKLNDFRGFQCGTKLSIISIDYRGGASISLCSQRNPINIHREDISKFLDSRICEQSECRNPSDLRIYKVKE